MWKEAEKSSRTVKIAEPTADTVKAIEDTASKDNYQLVVKPLEFSITCTNNEKLYRNNFAHNYSM